MSSVLDLLFPRRCVGCGKQGQYFCLGCRGELVRLRGTICPMCNRQALAGKTHSGCAKRRGMSGLVSLFVYTGIMRQGIKKLKFRFVSDLLDELAELLGQRLEEMGWPGDYWRQGGFTVVAVPLYSARERWRGFNQAAEIGKRLAANSKLNYREGLLERTRKTAAQSEIKPELTIQKLTELRAAAVSEFDFGERKKMALMKAVRQQRLKNIRGAFRINLKLKMKNEKLEKDNFLLVDDVWTSGATMRECAQVLKRAGAGEVWGLTVAR